MALSVGDRPSRMPSGSPAAIAIASPSAKAVALTRSGGQIAPVANMFHSVAAIRLGVVKNSLVPGESGQQVRHELPDEQHERDACRRRGERAPGSRHGRAARVPPLQRHGAVRHDRIASCASSYCPTRQGNAVRSAQRMPFGEHHRDDHDDQDAGEHPIEREQIAEPRDGIADAFRGGEELADQHPDERAADARCARRRRCRAARWER